MPTEPRINFVLFTLAALCIASAPATSPSTRPVDPVVTWLSELADRDPDVRDTARERLMSLPRERLKDLRQAVATRQPIAPAQALALREIVTHVFLSGEGYAQDVGGGGFVGVRMDPNTSDRVVIAARIPGFDAYRALRDGDVIVAVIVEETVPIVNYKHFGDVIASRRGGELICLKVERGGRSIVVPLTLSPRPADPSHADQMRAEQMPVADEFWDRNFAPLLEGTAASR